MSYGQSTHLRRSPNDLSSETRSAITTTDAVQYLLSKLNRTSVREQRVQALLFIAEAKWHKEKSTSISLLDTRFEKIRRGVFSPDIRSAIETLNLRSRPSFRDDVRTKVYDISLIEEPSDMSGKKVPEAIDRLEKVIDRFDDYPTENLMQWCLTFEQVEPLTSGETVEFD